MIVFCFYAVQSTTIIRQGLTFDTDISQMHAESNETYLRSVQFTHSIQQASITLLVL